MNTVFSLFLRFGPNLYAAYKNKSLLKSSELPALAVAVVGLAAPAVPGFPAEAAEPIGQLVGYSLAYASFRIAGKGLNGASTQ